MNKEHYGTSFKIGLERIESISIPDFSSIDINDAIEFYKLKNALESGSRLTSWSDSEYEDYTKKTKELYRITCRFFNSISDENVISEFNTMDELNEESFWELFELCKCYAHVSEERFSELMQNSRTSINFILEHKAIVDKYDKSLKVFLFGNVEYARIFVHAYEQLFNPGIKKIYLPSSITSDDINSILERYIDSEQPGFHVLETILHMPQKEKFKVSDYIKSKAQKRYNEITEEYFKSGAGIELGAQVFITDVDETETEEINGITKKKYSKSWLIDTLDFPSILNNFIYIFEFVDILQVRSQHTSIESHISTMERIFLHGDSANIYKTSMFFRKKDLLAQSQIAHYYQFLLENGVRYESVLEWFFTTYLQEEFSCPQMYVSFPSEKCTYLEKCILICTALDSIIKQYKYFVDYGIIDPEMILISSSSFKLSDIKSSIKRKYAYGTGDTYKNLCYILFSDQSMLYINQHKNNNRYSSFWETILKERISINEFTFELELNQLQYLIERNILNTDSDGYLVVSDGIMLSIIADLYYQGVICIPHLDDKYREKLECMEASGLVRVTDTFLSEPEIDYFDYFLNNASFVNGIMLRNKYIHGTQYVINNENYHMQNYFVLLRLFTLFAIKLNDDFCLIDGMRKAI